MFDALGRGGLRRDFDLDGIVDELPAQIGNRLRHGGREEQALALLGEQCGDALERHDEAQVHHLVGFVEHENLDMAQRQRALLDQVEQTARRGDENVAAAIKRAGLLANGHAAEHALDREAQVLGIAAHVVGDLGGQLAGRRKHQHAATGILARLGIGGQAVQRGQRESGGLAGAGLGDAQQVAAFEQRRNGLALDRCGIGIAFVCERAEKGLGKAKFGKIGHASLSKKARVARFKGRLRSARTARCRYVRPCVKKEAWFSVQPLVRAGPAFSRRNLTLLADCGRALRPHTPVVRRPSRSACGKKQDNYACLKRTRMLGTRNASRPITLYRTLPDRRCLGALSWLCPFNGRNYRLA